MGLKLALSTPLLDFSITFHRPHLSRRSSRPQPKRPSRPLTKSFSPPATSPAAPPTTTLPPVPGQWPAAASGSRTAHWVQSQSVSSGSERGSEHSSDCLPPGAWRVPETVVDREGSVSPGSSISVRGLRLPPGSYPRMAGGESEMHGGREGARTAGAGAAGGAARRRRQRAESVDSTGSPPPSYHSRAPVRRAVISGALARMVRRRDVPAPAPAPAAAPVRAQMIRRKPVPQRKRRVVPGAFPE